MRLLQRLLKLNSQCCVVHADSAQDSDNEFSLDHLDALVQAGLVILWQHAHGFLGDDGARIDASINKVDGRACDLGTVGQRIAHAMCSFESGQECRVSIDGATFKAVQKILAQNLHETGRNNNVWLCSIYCINQTSIPFGTVLTHLHHLGGDSRCLCALDALTRHVRENFHHAKVLVLTIKDGLQQRAGSRDQNDDVEAGRSSGLVRCSHALQPSACGEQTENYLTLGGVLIKVRVCGHALGDVPLITLLSICLIRVGHVRSVLLGLGLLVVLIDVFRIVHLGVNNV